MKKSLLTLTALAATAAAASAQVAFIPGNLVVSRVGDGANALANSGGAISLLELTTNGTAVRTIDIPTSTLQWSGTATSEGVISLSKDRTQLTLVGYTPPFGGTGSLASRTDANAPRAYLNINFNGTIGAVTQVGAFSGNNIRSGVTDGTGVWLAGGTTGTVYNSGSNTTIQSTVTNTRVVNIFGDKLFFSTGAGTNRGIYTFDSATPTSAATASVVINMGSSADPYDFAFNDSLTRAYVTNGNVIQRWDLDGSAWTLTNTSSVIGTGLTGLAVNFGTTSDSIFTVNPSTLFSLNFSEGAFSAATTLATAGTNFAFRGLEFAPIPEPSAFAGLAGLGALGFAALRRRRRA